MLPFFVVTKKFFRFVKNAMKLSVSSTPSYARHAHHSKRRNFLHSQFFILNS